MKNKKLFIILLIIIIALVVFLQNADSKANIDAKFETSGDETQILLYFLDDAGTTLVPEYRYVALKNIKEDMLKTLIDELLKRPKNSMQYRMHPAKYEAK